MKRSIGRRMLVVLWLGACTAALVGLWSVDQSRFDLPPHDPARWSRWASGRDLLDATAGIARLLATLALSYLLLVSVMHLLALLWGLRGLLRLTARLSPGPLAALLGAAVLSGSPLAAAVGPPDAATRVASGDDRDPPPVMRVLGEEPPRSTTTVAPRRAPFPIGASDQGSGPRRSDSPAPDVSATPAPDRATPAPGSPVSYTVVEGDHLWAIADRRVRSSLGRCGSEAEVRAYWLALIAMNASRMVEPGNPDLLLPGQELQLPG